MIIVSCYIYIISDNKRLLLKHNSEILNEFLYIMYKDAINEMNNSFTVSVR